jgi:DNA recombination protein RmuC
MSDLLIYGLIFLGGLIIGVVVTIVITRLYKPYYKQDILSVGGEIQKNLAAFTDTSMQASVQHLVEVSEQVLAKHTQATEQGLDTKKQLIDQSIKQALGNAKVRGQWGERMADDILRNIGFVEGTNYRKQQVSESSGNRPDYTFIMPNNLKLNMDVKFPLDNYMKYVNEESDADREGYKNAFIRDARQRISEVTTRDYIDPDQNTVDYVLVLIPNEQVYRFINENDPTILDFSLQSKVILCSPVTLYAVLALINQAARNFKMEKAIDEIIQQVSFFLIQWQKYVESMDKMGKRLADAQREFDNLMTRRKTRLERPLKKIDDIRKERGIDELEPIESEARLVEGGESCSVDEH